MGYEALGQHTQLGSAPSTYSREASPLLFDVCQRWKAEIQNLLDAGLLKHHPIRELPGKWEGIADGLAMLKRGEVRGQKLVIRLAEGFGSGEVSIQQTHRNK